MGLVWLRHAEHGGAAQFAEEALEAWRVKGWEPCDAPIDPDPALIEHVPDGLQRIAYIPVLNNGIAFTPADLNNSAEAEPNNSPEED